MVYCPHCKTEIKHESAKHENKIKRCPFCSLILGIDDEDSTIKNYPHPKKMGKDDDWAFMVLSIAFLMFFLLIVVIII